MLDKLTQYAQQLGFADLERRLSRISASLSDGKAELAVPLVGEFSAGKTTLVNALTDAKALECASKPTTATIYAIRFGSETPRAIVHYEDGRVSEVSDLTALKNDQLADAALVEVYDTSKRVPESVVLVDTPGLSSQEAKHRQALVDFLPQADAIILVSDVNQQITRSLADFAKTIALSNRPIYLAFSQCDTKSAEEIKEAKLYLQKHTELPLSGVISLSAKTDELGELYALLEGIQRDKTAILERVNQYRASEIAREMVERIDTLLASTESDSSIDEAIRAQQISLNKIRMQISRLEDEISAEVSGLQSEASRKFEERISERLESIVAGKASGSYDSEAQQAINNTASLILSEYHSKVKSLFAQAVREHARQGSEVSFAGINELALPELSGNLAQSYNINLDTVGHEWDKAIADGLTVAAVAGVVIAGGVALAGSGAAAAGGAATSAGGVATTVSAADTISDVGSMVSNYKLRKALKKGKEFGQGFEQVSQLDKTVGQSLGQKKGLVESLVGLVTEPTWGKPQRKRAIENYIVETLVPAFREEMRRISTEVNTLVSHHLNSSSEEKTSELTASLEALKRDRHEQKTAFEARLKELKQIKQQLISL